MHARSGGKDPLKANFQRIRERKKERESGTDKRKREITTMKISCLFFLFLPSTHTLHNLINATRTCMEMGMKATFGGKVKEHQ